MATKLAVLPFVLLLGSVACQDFNGAPSSSPTAAPSPGPSKNIMKRISPMHPPSPSSNAPAYHPAPGPSPSSSAAPPVFPVASGPSPSSSVVPGPTASPTASSPRPSKNIMKRISPMHPPSSNAPAYPPPGPSPSGSAAPPVFPVASSPGPSPSSWVVPGPTASPPSPGPAPSSGVRVGYYANSCPNAESIVRSAVQSAVGSNPGIGAGLIRLFFHDCFVQGCDASVLLNTTGSADPTERQSPPNLTLRGFEVIDAAKARLETECPGVVSCADVVAFAGRDATSFLSGGAVDFSMPAGRLDGRVSRSSDALADLPPPTAGLQRLKDMFAAKGLDAGDMVTLSGAHTVGVSHCSSFSDRLPPNNASDDAMNPTLAASLTQQCNASGGGGDGDPTVSQDLVTPNKLDSQYYWNVLNHDVLFTSDAALLASNQTADMVSANAFTPGLWETKFKAAMVKMGLVGIKTGADGEIRQKCWMINN